MPTLSDVAEAAGVSVATASRVLNRGKYAERISAACQERVKAAADRVGYVANYHAQTMKRGLAQTIAVALEISGPEEDRTPEALAGNAYHMSLIAGIEAATHKAGFALTLMGPTESDKAQERVVTGIREKRFDGGVLLAITVRPKDAGLLLESPDLPLVAVQPLVPTQLPVVDFDAGTGIAMVVDHLAQLGHRDLLWVGSEDDSRGPTREQRFVTEVWDAGLSGSSLRFATPPFESQDPRVELIERADAAMTAALGKRRTFTAVACANDLVALGVCRALLRTGKRIPQDVSVVGFDNVEAKTAWPPLTTVDHQFTRMGLEAGRLVLELIRGGGEKRAEQRGRRTVIQPHLIVRESTGLVPG